MIDQATANQIHTDLHLARLMLRAAQDEKPAASVLDSIWAGLENLTSEVTTVSEIRINGQLVSITLGS